MDNHVYDVLNITVFENNLNFGGVGFFAIIATLHRKP